MAAVKAPNDKRNILVYSDDGKFYLINQTAWEVKENIVEPKDAPSAQQLIDRGAELAVIPSTGGGNICTLVNLKSLIK